LDLPDCRDIGRRERYLGLATVAALIVLAFGQLRTGAQAPTPTPLEPVPAIGPVNAVVSYGADPTWGTNPKAKDSADAIQAALDANPGRVVYLPPGKYYCSHELTIRSTLTLTGEAVGRWFRQRTVLAFAAGSRGIVVLDDPRTGGAQESRISYLVLWGLYQNSPLPAKYFVPGEDGVTPLFIGPTADGIDVQAGVELDHLRVTTVGLRSRSPARRTRGGGSTTPRVSATPTSRPTLGPTASTARPRVAPIGSAPAAPPRAGSMRPA
jgi:hypothetical protein